MHKAYALASTSQPASWTKRVNHSRQRLCLCGVEMEEGSCPVGGPCGDTALCIIGRGVSGDLQIRGGRALINKKGRGGSDHDRADEGGKEGSGTPPTPHHCAFSNLPIEPWGRGIPCHLEPFRIAKIYINSGNQTWRGGLKSGVVEKKSRNMIDGAGTIFTLFPNRYKRFWRIVIVPLKKKN